jgi:hypothetical protein
LPPPLPRSTRWSRRPSGLEPGSEATGRAPPPKLAWVQPKPR